MLIIGLTGSIAMGKSTVAGFFKDQNIPIISADEIVHNLYENEAAGVIECVFPGSTKNGKVDRSALFSCLQNDPGGEQQAFKKLEGLIHPLVRKKQWQFIEKNKANKVDLVIIEIPLLFETGAEKNLDAVILVSASHETQQKRVMQREGMTQEKFKTLLARQMPDEEKRKKANYIINTDTTFEETKNQTREIFNRLKSENLNISPAAYQKWQLEMQNI